MKLKLPDTIYSQQDLRAVTVEVRGYARWFSHTATKKHFSARATSEAPVLSAGAAQLIEDLRAKKELSSEGLDKLIAQLKQLTEKAPKLTITLAAPAASGLKTTLVTWCRQNIADDVLVSFGFNSTLLGGMVVRSGSHIFDWSFRRQILEARAKFPEIYEMFDDQTFQRLVEADNLTGEVVATNSFIIEVKGLEGVRLGSQVLFEDGQRGLVREAYGDRVILFNVSSERIEPGTLAVVEDDVLSVPVGKKLVGRVISPMGEPLDGKGPIHTTAKSGVFNPAPGIMARSVLNEQLPSGVTAVDMFFPVVLGQRIAILGDSKSGKSAFLSQLSASQEGTDRIVVYVLIGRRKVDVEHLLSGLRESGAMEHTIVVLADIFDSLTQSYLAPYAACAMAEHLWYGGQDVIIMYDDLSSHAEAYRQLSLLQEVDPGRDSYPGDIFYAHSSLLERAGKLKTNGKTLTALPVVLTPNDDITAYLSTSIMSITDGQIIFDLGIFRRGIRPAVNAGLSVSRVGGQAQTTRQKRLSSTLFKTLARYRQAEEFSHFSSQLSKETRIDLTLGKYIYEALQQPPEERRSLVEQQLLMETILLSGGEMEIDVAALKETIGKIGKHVKDEKDFDSLEAQMLKKHAAEPLATKPADQKIDTTAEAEAKPEEAGKK